jgi:hypothetical protein
VRPLLPLISGLALFVAVTSSATTITFVAENSTTAANWRTSSVAKTPNPANNNIYGNDGYVMFNTTQTSSTQVVNFTSVNVFTFSTTLNGFTYTTLNTLNTASMPSYVTSFTPASSLTSLYSQGTTTSGGPKYLTMDNPAGGSMLSGVAYETGNNPTTFKPLFSFTVGNTVPSSFTVGIFFNNSLGEWSQAQIVGGGATATGTRLVFGTIDALFFKISGATSGTVFTVQGESSTSAPGANTNLDIVGITFDSVPEPSTLGACASAAFALMWLGRKSKKRRGAIPCDTDPPASAR